MVKPGGTGKPRLAISARLAPLPPRRSRRWAPPSALPSPKVKTQWPLPRAGLAAARRARFAGDLRRDLLGMSTCVTAIRYLYLPNRDPWRNAPHRRLGQFQAQTRACAPFLL